MPSMWTIYDHPSDYPNTFVCRKWVADRHGGPRACAGVIIAATLEECRAAIKAQYPGLTCIGRDNSDDPCIVETWV